MVVDLFEMIK